MTAPPDCLQGKKNNEKKSTDVVSHSFTPPFLSSIYLSSCFSLLHFFSWIEFFFLNLKPLLAVALLFSAFVHSFHFSSRSMEAPLSVSLLRADIKVTQLSGQSTLKCRAEPPADFRFYCADMEERKDDLLMEGLILPSVYFCILQSTRTIWHVSPQHISMAQLH